MEVERFSSLSLGPGDVVRLPETHLIFLRVRGSVLYPFPLVYFAERWPVGVRSRVRTSHDVSWLTVGSLEDSPDPGGAGLSSLRSS